MKDIPAFYLSLNRVKWNELFDSEAELISVALSIPIKAGGIVPKGYEYLKGMHRTYDTYGELTPRQVTQLKRIAKNVYAVANSMRIGGFYTTI